VHDDCSLVVSGLNLGNFFIGKLSGFKARWDFAFGPWLSTLPSRSASAASTWATIAWSTPVSFWPSAPDVEHPASASTNATPAPMLVISFFIVFLLGFYYFLMDGWCF
jgi:hypothetical protein